MEDRKALYATHIQAEAGAAFIYREDQERYIPVKFSVRGRDLVWNYVVNNYLKGEAPKPFDLLFWNSDSTNLPGPFVTYYLRNMYLENNLRVPNKLTMLGEPVAMPVATFTTIGKKQSDSDVSTAGTVPEPNQRTKIGTTATLGIDEKPISSG